MHGRTPFRHTPVEAPQLALLHRVSAIVSSGLSLDKMLEELILTVVGVTECDACLVYLIESSTDEIVLCASQLPHVMQGNIRMRVGEGVAGWVAEHKAVVALSERASEDRRFKAFMTLPEDTYDALLSVPMICDDTVIGVVNVHHGDPHAHSADEVALMTYVGEQMGGAIARARLAEQSRSATRRVQTLAAVGDTLSTEGDLDRILQVVCEMVADTFGALLCSIMAVDREATLLEIKAVNSRSPERLNKLPLKVDESLIGRVVRERRLLVVPDVSMEELYSDPDYARRAGLTSLVSAPLIAGSSVTGALNVYTRDRRAFSDEELGFVRAVAGQVSLVFENSRLMAETLEMKRALETRKLVERAKGILQQRNGLSEEQAYLELRNESRRLRRPMRTLAEAIVLAESLHRKAETTDQAGDPKSRAAADGSGAPH